MTWRVAVALDVGTAATRIALGAPGGAPVVETRPTPARGLAVFLSKLLEAGRARAPGAIAGMTVTVPEAWLDGSAEGIRAYERLRRTVLDELGWHDVTWVAQAGCVAAEAVAARPRTGGPVLVCDLGARTITAALCDVDGSTVRVRSVAVDARGAGLAFDAAVAEAAATAPAPSPTHETPFTDPANTGLDPAHAGLDPGRGGFDAGRTGLDVTGGWGGAGFEALFAGARTRQGRRAAVVLPRAWTHRRYREAPVYRVGDRTVTAGTLIDAFASTAAALAGVVRRTTAGGPPAVVAISGKFGVFPLVSRVLADELDASEPPLVLGPGAAVRGALRIASGEVTLAPPERPAVTLPLHRVRRGLLEVREVPLDPSADFAVQDGYAVLVEVPAGAAPEFGVRVDGREVAVRPDLPPGHYRVGLRPSHAGPGVLVLAPADGGEPRLQPIVPPT